MSSGFDSLHDLPEFEVNFQQKRMLSKRLWSLSHITFSTPRWWNSRIAKSFPTIPRTTMANRERRKNLKQAIRKWTSISVRLQGAPCNRQKKSFGSIHWIPWRSIIHPQRSRTILWRSIVLRHSAKPGEANTVVTNPAREKDVKKGTRKFLRVASSL